MSDQFVLVEPPQNGGIQATSTTTAIILTSQRAKKQTMPPKTASSQNRLAFKSQSKPKSSFYTTVKAKNAAIKTQSLTKSSIANVKPAKVSPAPEADVSNLDELDVNDARWDSLWRQTKKQMNVPASKSIHIDHENRVEQILRVFDLDPNYGPSIGLSRLERWQRAQDLDLDPPQEIKQILTTKQGSTAHSQNIFTNHGL